MEQRYPSRLPHWQPEDKAYFVTWRLHGSLPASVVADLWTGDGPKFVKADRLLDSRASGPKWLKEPSVARAVISRLLEGERRGSYELGAWVIMPNHVHLILRPHDDLPKVINGIKSWSAREANRVLNRPGKPFWARDYFDRWIRNAWEEAKIIRYIEMNPVNAGLCSEPSDWPWSHWSHKNAAIAACPL